MVKNIHTCITLLLSTLVSGPVSIAARAGEEQVAILLRDQTQAALELPLNQYIRDVEERFPVRLHVIKRDWRTPEEVRAAIKTLDAEKHISGVILVGAMPMHRFFMHGFANPNPLYYEDFDLKFVDRNKDGFADAYEGASNLKVWVANIRCSVKADDDDIPNLRKFFAKTHAYYTSAKDENPRALALSANDWPAGGSWFRDVAGTKLVGKDRVDVLEAKSCTIGAIRNAFKNHSYSICYLQIHSDWNGHDLDDGKRLTAAEVAGMKPGALITINHGCSSGNWMHNDSEKTSPNTAMSWVFGESIGQAVIAQVRTGMIYGQEAIYARLLAGDYLGKAYCAGKQEAENMHAKGDHIPGDIVSGVLLLGNPFLQLDPAPH